MKSEQEIMHEVLAALTAAGCKVWRNNVGAVSDGARYIRYGLCAGASDIIGIAPDGRFLAVEVKAKGGRVKQEQQQFINIVNAAGGIAGVVRSVEDAHNLLNTRRTR